MKSQWTEKRIMVLKIGIDLERKKEGVRDKCSVECFVSEYLWGTTESSKQHIDDSSKRKDIIYFFLSAPISDSATFLTE